MPPVAVSPHEKKPAALFPDAWRPQEALFPEPSLPHDALLPVALALAKSLPWER